MHKILILFFLLNSVGLWAQPGVAPKKEINGQMFYVHKVVQGNTLWGLQQMYGVKVDDIMNANPALSEGLKTGQDVLIPVKEYAQPIPETSEYKVKKGETLYGLSRKFNTTVDELIRLNPALAEEGLQKGEIIKVPGKVQDETSDTVDVDPIEDPVPNPFVVDTVENKGQETVTVVSFSDSTIRHTVLAHETMYSISKRFMVSIEQIMKTNELKSTTLREGQVLVIPVKQEHIEKLVIKPVPPAYDPNSPDSIEFTDKERYKVAIILPFHLDYSAGYSSYISDLATQFYMGAMMALDSLEKKGLNADVQFFDSKKDSAAVLSILNSREFQNVDLVIGPFYSVPQKLVAEYCKNNKIRMVSPVASDSELLENNRLVYSSVPSNITLMQGMAKYVLLHHSKDNIILVKPQKESDMPLYEAFRSSFKQSPTLTGNRPNLIETTIDGMNTYMRKDKKNVFIMPTANKTTAARFISSVNRSAFRAKKDEIYIFGTKDWMEFDDVSNYYKNKYNFHFASPNFIDYYRDDMIEFNRAFRAKYNTDLSKMAVQGYDVTMFYCSSFFLGKDNPHLFMNSFSMNQVSDTDGFENTNVFVVEQDEYELFNSEERLDD